TARGGAGRRGRRGIEDVARSARCGWRVVDDHPWTPIEAAVRQPHPDEEVVNERWSAAAGDDLLLDDRRCAGSRRRLRGTAGLGSGAGFCLCREVLINALQPRLEEALQVDLAGRLDAGAFERGVDD